MLQFSVFSLCLCGESYCICFCIFGGLFSSIHCNDTPICTRQTQASQSLHSAPSAGPTATRLCQFSGLLPCCRLSFQWKSCKICKFCNSYHIRVFVFASGLRTSHSGLSIDYGLCGLWKVSRKSATVFEFSPSPVYRGGLGWGFFSPFHDHLHHIVALAADKPEGFRKVCRRKRMRNQAFER